MASLAESAAYHSGLDQIDLEPLGSSFQQQQQHKTSNGDSMEKNNRIKSSRPENDAAELELPPFEGRDPHQHFGRPEPALVLFFEVN